MKLSPEKISKILGSPIENVERYWSLIIKYLQKYDRNKLSFQVAILATIGVETGNFLPIREGYWLSDKAMYRWCEDHYGINSQGKTPKQAQERRARARAMGHTQPGDGFKYRGGGFVQLTWKKNYEKYGKRIGVDLVAHPEKITDPEVAAEILVLFCIDHGIDVWADRAFRPDDEYPEEKCTRKIRRLVNGGLNHYDKFKRFWDKLKAEALRD